MSFRQPAARLLHPSVPAPLPRHLIKLFSRLSHHKHEGRVRSGGGPRGGSLSFQRGRTRSPPCRCPPVIDRCVGRIRPGRTHPKAVGRNQEQEGVCRCREQKKGGREEVRGHRHFHEGNGVRKEGPHLRQGRRDVDQAHARWCPGREAKLTDSVLNGDFIMSGLHPRCLRYLRVSQRHYFFFGGGGHFAGCCRT